MTRLANAPNFRDVGALPLAGGGSLRAGTIYRSGQLSSLDEADLRRVETLGIRLVCDLRSSGERQRFASRWPALAPARTIEMPASTDHGAGMQNLIDRLAGEPGAAGARRAMLDLYASLPGLLSPTLATASEAMASGWGVPVLLHCHVGKDRTGVATALLLKALDVSHDAILADYEETGRRIDIAEETRYIARGLNKRLGTTVDPGALDALGRTDPAYLDSAFAAIEREWGGVDAYLTAVGITASRRARLAALFHA
ncbi:unnamed protein product [Acidocella sp. C78]|uniref:tyrosine-protein phosphatase n=1 Tax=Acidocella sp. C78 TaxID=1671486 RepID=UPI00191BBA98|nr:tyrosine-protein phosphatase [Acidocella sp. C78]CAG4915441.1 unnamed protein product [Acidocella sp. C78]